MRTFLFLMALGALHICSLSGQTGTLQYSITDLGNLGLGDLAVAWGVNSSGEVAGERVASTGGADSFVFRDNTLSTFQAAAALGGISSRAYGVNAGGQVVGAVLKAAPGLRHGYIYSSGRVIDLHPAVSLGGPTSFATGINDVGDIVGASSATPAPGSDDRHAFLYQNGKLTDLHQAVGFGGGWSEALGINALGDIVGASKTTEGDCYHAFLLRTSTSSTSDLHSAVQAGGCSSRASGINGKGEIVGSATTGSGGSRAVLYANGAATDLNSLMPPNSGWVLEFANGINDGGQIVGLGRYMDQPRSFLLTPMAGSSASPAGPLGVSEVLKSQDLYVGQRISINGKMQIIPHYSLLSCGAGVPSCTPIIGVSVLLQDLDDATKTLLIYRNGSPYSCTYDIQGNYGCPPFTHNVVTVLNGVYSKGKEPDFVIGSASPSGGPSAPQVVTFKDFYYFDVGPAAGAPMLHVPLPPPRSRGRGVR